MSDQVHETYEPQEEQENPKVMRYIMIGLGGLAAFIVISLIVAIIAGLTNSEGLASGFRIIRDFLIIILALQGIFISIAMVVLIVQLSSLINLLSNEVKPILDELRDTATTARGTAQFVSKNVADPVIKVAATAAGVRSFFGQLVAIQRNNRGEPLRARIEAEQRAARRNGKKE